MAAVGHMYANGRGVAQNNATAIKWFTRAASDDPGPPDASALFGLGYMQLHGYGAFVRLHLLFTARSARQRAIHRCEVTICATVSPGVVAALDVGPVGGALPAGRCSVSW